MKPLDLLLPYQRRWALDDARFKIWIASRQIGKSFTSAAEVALHCHLHPGTHWVLVSAGQRQALELIDKVKQWLKAFELAIASQGMDGDPADFRAAEIRLANGSRITALPANPDTVRGYSANLLLDEFAFHRDATALWRAILPAITNPLRGELKVRICSTPNGQGGPGETFYRLWTGEPGDKWSRHQTTIHDAHADGLHVDIETLRTQAADADGFAQEYECAFIDSSRTAFPYDIITACESPDATIHLPAELPPATTLYAGIDIGTISDPTVAVTLARDPRGLRVIHVLRLQTMQLSDQDQHLHPIIARAARTSIDASGLGTDIAQRMVRRHGGKVIPQAVTSTWKRTAMRALRSHIADRRILIPSDRRLRDDLHAYQVTGAGETENYWAPRNADGHSDFTAALAHALDAALVTHQGAFDHAAAAEIHIGIPPHSTRHRPRFTPLRH